MFKRTAPLFALITCTIGLVSFTSNGQHTVARDLYDKANGELDAKIYDRACRDFTSAIVADSTYGIAYEGRGAAEYYLGRYDKSLTDELAALRLNPLLKNVHNWIALNMLELKNYSGAAEYFGKTIAAGNSDNLGRAYEGRGSAEYYLGQYQKALDDENSAIEADTKLENAYYWRAMVKEEMKDYSGALDDHLKSLAIGANTSKDYEGLAIDESHLGNNEKALQYISKAVIDTTLKNAWNWSAKIRQDMEDYVGSIEDYNESLKIGANKGRDYEGRAVDEYYLKQYSAALKDINLAIDADTTLKQAQNWKHAIEEKLGKH